MKYARQFSRAVALGSALVACGGDEAPASPETDTTRAASRPALPDGSFSTGLSPALSVASLDPADRVTVCEATARAIPLVASCPSWGLTAAYNLAFDPAYDDGGALPSDARLYEACSSTVRQCEATYASSPPPECDLGFRDTCSGSIGQLERCINDTLAATRTLLAATPACEELSCTTFPQVAQQWLSDNHTFSERLASCSEFYETCPDAAGAEYLEPGGTPMVPDLTIECAD
jgi:hypothetical protein